MKPVRAKEAVDKIKDNILNSSLDIIVSDGFAALTMRRLATQIGMTAPNIYNYFANKDEIYLTLMIKGFDSLISSLTSERAQQSEPMQRARAMISAYLRFGIENDRYYALMFSSTAPKYRDYIGTEQELLSSREHAVSMQLAELALVTVQEVASARGLAINDEQAKLTLTTIWSLLHGMVSLHNSQNIGYVVADVALVYQQIVELVMRQIQSLLRQS